MYSATGPRPEAVSRAEEISTRNEFLMGTTCYLFEIANIIRYDDALHSPSHGSVVSIPSNGTLHDQGISNKQVYFWF